MNASASEPIADPRVTASAVGPEAEAEVAADLDDEELGDLLIRELTIDGMCGVY
jgi:mycofactocin precursor